ncbi:MAG: amidohydrolase family protein [Bryobacteraceae bacterium]|nr:amidohydrolase family protein [Bryobacteraceae bacterium]
MRTSWGELRVLDAHVHFFSHGFFTLLARQKDGLTLESMTSTLGWDMPPPEPERLARRWVEELDRHGVERAALIASLPGDEASVAAAVAAYPDRFFGYFMVNPCAQDASARCRSALASGLRGVCLFPAMHRYSLHDERVGPVLDVAASTPGAIVFIHCGVLSVGVRNRLGLPSPFDMRFSNPIDVHALALRYPGVTFVLPHFGAGYFREALMVCGLCPNVCLDTSSTNSWMRYNPRPLDLKAVFERALDVAGSRRLLFGTDSSFFPRGWNRAIFDAQAQALSSLGAGAADAEAVFGGNLARLLSGS